MVAKLQGDKSASRHPWNLNEATLGHLKPLYRALQNCYISKAYLIEKYLVGICTCVLNLDVPIRGAQFAADRIAPIRSDLKSHDSNRNPKFHSIRCDVFTIFQMFRYFQIAQFDSRDSVR